jgi:4-carboxymuconolactone decarboxylase
MTAGTRALVEVAVALGAPDRAGLRTALIDARTLVGAAAVEEVLLQSYLFVGFPAVLQAFGVWRDLTPDAPAPGEADIPRAGDIDGPAARQARGHAVMERVYGDQNVRLLDNVARLHPDLAQWMLEEGYGKVLSRPGVSLDVRELCMVALLCMQDAESQLYSHLRGALQTGAAVADVEEVLAIALARVPEERAIRARAVWQTVRSRRGG